MKRRTLWVLLCVGLLSPFACTVKEDVGAADGGVLEAPDSSVTAGFTVISTTPPNDVMGVAINISIQARFSSAADPATINATTFTVNGVTGTVSYDVTSRTATFVPSAPLAKLTQYTATVTTGAQSTAGKALAASYTWTFTTGPVVATREAHSLVLKSDGTLWGWGLNTEGQLGDNSKIERDTPVSATELSAYTLASIATGAAHSLALTSTGHVLAWGRNWDGELGRGTHATTELVPAETSGLLDVKAIAAGRYFSMALKRDGSVWCWGLGGPLGDGTDANRYSPVQAQGLTDITAIDAGAVHAIALKSDGTVWTWGSNSSGQIGNGVSGVSGTPGSKDQYTPLQVPGLSGVVAIAAGYRHNLVLKSDGTVWGWGGNSNELFPSTDAAILSPMLLPALANVNAIASGYWHSIASKTDGTVVSWGNRSYGQLGDGLTLTDPNSVTPLLTVGLSNVAVIAGGENFGLALETDGTVLTWGSPESGRLGLSPVPTLSVKTATVLAVY